MLSNIVIERVAFAENNFYMEVALKLDRKYRTQCFANKKKFRLLIRTGTDIRLTSCIIRGTALLAEVLPS